MREREAAERSARRLLSPLWDKHSDLVVATFLEPLNSQQDTST